MIMIGMMILITLQWDMCIGMESIILKVLDKDEIRISSDSFNAFMPHEISKKRYIITTFQETFCKSVLE